MTTNVIASLQALKKQYPDQTWALQEIDLEIRAGEVLGLVGANGSGKTTLLNILGGVTPITSGEFTLFGKPVHQFRPSFLRQRVGIASQDPALDPEMTVGETVRFFAQLYGLSRTQRAQRFQETTQQFGLTDFLGKRVSRLSGGQRQRVHLALALLPHPTLLLLDEPSSALDPKLRAQFWQVLRSALSSDRAVVVATHNLIDAEAHFDRIAVLSHGSLLETEPPEKLRTKHARPRLEILFASRGELPSTLEKDVGKFPKVEAARLQGRTLNIRFKETGDTGVQVLNELKKRQLRIEEIREHPPTLEEAYFGLAGELLQTRTWSSGKPKAGRGQRQRSTS